MSTPFRWDHPELDRVCGKLKDFSTILFAAKDPGDLETLWDLAGSNLVQNVKAAGLQVFVFDARSENQDVLSTSAARSADVILFHQKSSNGLARNVSLIQLLSQLPGAILAFGNEQSPHWNNFFDLTLIFKDSVCTLTDRNSQKLAEEPCDLDHAVSPSDLREVPVIYCLNVPEALRKDISSMIKSNQASVVSIERSDFAKGETFFKAGDLFILETPEYEPSLDEFFRRSMLAGTPTVVLAKKVKREEDRLRLYDAGATFVIAKEASHAEVLATLGSILRFMNHGRISTYFPLRQWDEDFQRMSVRVKRDLFWKSDETNELKEYYCALTAHILKRAILSATPCGILWVPLPDLSGVKDKGPWVNLMRKTLLQSLIATVRQRDLTFVYNDHFVLISGDLSPLSSAYVVKRIENQLSNLGEASPQIRKFTFPVVAGDLEKQALVLLDELLENLDQTAAE